MASENQSVQPLQKNKTASLNAIISKIAVFLNYISKNEHDKLTRELERLSKSNAHPPDILHLMLEMNYVSAQDCMTLKKACISFTKKQDDTRFGALCIEFNFLTQSNLDLALEEQKRLENNGQPIRLGELLMDAGMISTAQKKLILQKQKLNASITGDTPPKIHPEKEHHAEPAIDTSCMREIRHSVFIFYINPDGLKACVMKSPDFENAPDADSLFKESLELNGIIYGLVDSERYKDFLASDLYQTQVFDLAQGTPPIPPKDAVIKYTFEQDYLRPGNLKEDGSIDFRERGEIPFVSKGDLLAVKTPPENGKEGVNIFGDTIPVTEARDTPIKAGKGVRLSEDECQAFADVEGNPKLDTDGLLSVNDAYFIEGDVDFHTGHVKFDKNIYITGAIKDGFRVEGIDVVANAVDGGVIRAKGDILIKNGITEAQVHADGHINATYIHRSAITCMRDLKVIKELVDTEASMDGMCLLKNGRMYASTISAKGGAVIKDVGSDKAKPSDISVGTSTYIENEIKRIDAKIETFQNALEKNTFEKNRCETELEAVTEKLDNLLDSRKRTQAMLKTLKAQNKLDNITLFQNSLIEATEKIEGLNPTRHSLIKKLKKISEESRFNSEQVKTAVQQKFKIKRLEQNTPSKPILDVGGTIFSGNRIHGKYARTVIGETQTRVRIMEMGTGGNEHTKKSWDMVITSL